MRLAPKIFLPLGAVLTAAALLVLALGYFIAQDIQRHLLERLAHNYETTIRLLMEHSITEARDVAALFLRLPEVEAAYRIALSGNINAEDDPKAQEARQMLRTALKPLLAGYEKTTGNKLKLHFHLPSNRSLVRLWRSVNFQRGGKDLDISDDISSFRQTVVRANAERQPQSGVEVGVGGFDLRSVLPITAADGTHLGSVEVLVELGTILDEAAHRLGVDLALFMNDNLLPIAIQLQDTSKYPHLGGFVQIRAPADSATVAAMDPDWLMQASGGRTLRASTNRVLLAFPLHDFSKKQIGVLAIAQDTQELTALMRRAGSLAWIVGLALLALVYGVIHITISRTVLRPLHRLTRAALDIRNGSLDVEI